MLFLSKNPKVWGNEVRWSTKLQSLVGFECKLINTFLSAPARRRADLMHPSPVSAPCWPTCSWTSTATARQRDFSPSSPQTMSSSITWRVSKTLKNTLYGTHMTCSHGCNMWKHWNSYRTLASVFNCSVLWLLYSSAVVFLALWV